MSELRELYQTVILDHNKSPKNFGRPAGANRVARGHNPLCGDRVAVYAAVEDGRLVAVGFDGQGCAISTAAASLMTEAVKGKTVDEVAKLHDAYHEMVTAPPGAPADNAALGKLAVFEGVREYPMRVKCATLAWHALRAALAGDDVVSTE